MQLRTYQGRDIAGIRSSFAGGRRRVLSRSPTGSGKTVQFSTGVAVAAARGIGPPSSDIKPLCRPVCWVVWRLPLRLSV